MFLIDKILKNKRVQNEFNKRGLNILDFDGIAPIKRGEIFIIPDHSSCRGKSPKESKMKYMILMDWVYKVESAKKCLNFTICSENSDAKCFLNDSKKSEFKIEENPSICSKCVYNQKYKDFTF